MSAEPDSTTPLSPSLGVDELGVNALEVDALVQQITAAVTDLVWTSETDAPFEVLRWAGQAEEHLTPAQVLALAALPPTTPLQSLELDQFLAPAVQPQDWHTENECQSVQRFQTLQNLLQQTLRQIQVYRCGTTELEIYIVGQATATDWIAIHTTAVET